VLGRKKRNIFLILFCSPKVRLGLSSKVIRYVFNKSVCVCVWNNRYSFRMIAWGSSSCKYRMYAIFKKKQQTKEIKENKKSDGNRVNVNVRPIIPAAVVNNGEMRIKKQ
jgi:hypothetical protein